NIDTYLNTASNIKYTGASNVNGNDAATLTLTANDGGYTGTGGGTDVSLGTVNVDITAINDDPSISGLPTDITVTEDVASNVDLSAATLIDVDAGSNSIVLTVAASAGTLTASSGGSVTIGGSGTGTLILTGTVANIDTYLNTASNIKYAGASNANGNDAATLTLTANDGGYTGTGGGTNVSLGAVNVDITAVNDNPTASNFSATAIYEGTSYVFATSDFGYSDSDGDNLVKIAVNLVPVNGILYIDADNDDDYDVGEELAGGTSVSRANLDNGNLQYYNTDGASAYFQFVVYDGFVYSSLIYVATLTVISEPTVTLSLDPISTISENGGTTNVKATLSHSFNKNVTTNLLVSGLATGSGTDYTLPASSIVISAGNTSNSIQLSSVSDDIDENDETVIIDILSVTNGTESGTQQATATILDDDATPTIAFNSTISSGLESVSSANLQVDLSAASGLTVSVDYTVTGSATGSGTDYTLANGTLAIVAGDATDNITIVSIVDDLLDENNETVIVTLSNPVNATLGTNTVHTYIINDDDATPTIAFNLSSSNGAESVSSANLQVDLSSASGLTVAVDYTVTGTATGSGTDYTLVNGTLTIPAGTSNSNITIAGIVNDLFDENNETVIVTLSNPSNATLGTKTVHTYTIEDDDATPIIAFNLSSSNGDESVSSANLQVDLSAASGLTVTVDYIVTGTATGSGTDYTLANGTLTVAAGDATDNITIASIVNDLLIENNETVIVTLSNPTNAILGINTLHIYTITDNDTPPEVAFNLVSSVGLESIGSADLQVDLSAAFGFTITVDYTVTGTASGSGVDYTLADGTLTIAAGDASDNITIGSIVDDLLDENNETVIVTLSNPVNATLGTNTVHTYTINDDDATPTIAFNLSSSNGAESVSSANLQVDLSAVSGLTVTVDYSVNGNTASDGIDFIPASGTLTFAAGDTEADITIASIINDLFDENNETVIVTLSNPSNATLGTNTVYTYTINDDDATPTIEFNSTSSSGLESVSSANLQVDLSAASGLTVSVDYTVTGTATGSGTDYTLANGTLTIAA
ncbi:hypothetical protein DWB61_17675, partial [Ancylomarina euxinus]